MTVSVPTQESPLSGPYSFEGFRPAEECFPSAVLSALGDGRPDVAVVRAGENAFGTWGYLGVRKNASEFEVVGYTLEPRASVGKGPIPLGSTLR